MAQARNTLSLIYAIPDHPWTKVGKDAAAVRIAMTVAARGQQAGRLIEITHESGLESDTPTIEVSETRAMIHADLSVGANVGGAKALMANEGLSSRGVALHGAGFIVTPEQAEELKLGQREGLEAHIRPYRHGRDLLQTPRGVMVIDLFGLTEREVRTRFPEVYQHLLATVKPERDINRRATRRDNWWLFGELAPAFREYSDGLPRYIATVETAKHRIFQFLDASILPDNKLIVIGVDDAFSLGVLHSSIHLRWTFANCGLIGMADFEAGHVYVKSKCFDPFPFPDATPDQRVAIADLAEELDATRKSALAEVPGLTMTEIYNLRAWLTPSPLQGRGLGEGHVGSSDRSIRPSPSPSPEGEGNMADRASAARAGIVNRLHDQIDAAVAAAYGWPADLAPSEIITRLVALNAQRAAEEASGHIRWLRPDYQIGKFGNGALRGLEKSQ